MSQQDGGSPPRQGSGGSVARNSTVMAVGTFGSRVLGFVRTAMLTAVVGGALAADSFTVGNSLPTQVYVLINGGLLSAVLIPAFTRAMSHADRGRDYSDRLITLSLLVLGGSTLLMLLAAPLIVDLLSANKDPQFLSLTTYIAYLCLPQIFFYGLYSVLGQVLNVYGRFTAFAWAPAWANVVQIAGLAWFLLEWGQQASIRTWTPAMVWVLAGTTTLGIAVQGVSLAVPLYRMGFRYRPRFGWRGYGFREVGTMAGWTIAALVLSQVSGLVQTRAMTVGASQAEHVAGNAVQQYAYSLFILPHSLITVSIVTALYPQMARAHHDGDLAGMRHWLRRGLEGPAVLVIPATAALVALARPMAATLYPGLRYDPAHGIDEPADVALVLALMALGTLPFGITALKQRYCFARGDGWTNFWLVGLMAGGNILVALVAMYLTPPRYVVAVVALGMTLSSLVNAVVFVALARRQLHGLGFRPVLRLWVRLTVAAGLAGVAGWAVASLVAHRDGPWREQALGLAAGGAVLVLVFYVLARLLRIRQVDDMVGAVTSRAGRLVRR
ncbi:murein biosynthesis integral membrane protein MurJ [Phycicoccus endophyticus]|uniref:Murein biosynthesis integral membrane protein MurJ n=1 Tax=Phycicoccus endophyticus TaxID=1690220 RepID=A0A7G9R253_9MICO|nr:murein biosynthesis integral membrane protein MurJ [Phycicoccus endophyticus]NHI19670.1 murein biosynthesis integral membrane protein MurJ [Phycicoccus endophyticus]QNN49678.1 murein biosynthesis integral membrane protein MurJ [Phycicoccus endophyticus]GGL34020.1 lipid II flippase MurJ [Phycicoccus endophyticus]